MQIIDRKKQRGASRPLVICGLLLLSVLVMLGANYGPTLLGYYRFMQSVEAASQQAEATGGPWPQLTEVCMPCHGSSGNPVTQIYPRLAGQPALYLSQQLQAYASGERVDPIMSSLAINLSPLEVGQLSEFFAAQPATPNTYFIPDAQLPAQGERLAKAGACAACHGAELQGQASFPRLAGQGYDYLVKQLSAFKSGARIDSTGAMTAAVTDLSEQDIINLASYLAIKTGALHAQ